jgi:hypothetical protein
VLTEGNPPLAMMMRRVKLEIEGDPIPPKKSIERARWVRLLRELSPIWIAMRAWPRHKTAPWSLCAMVPEVSLPKGIR